MDPRTYYWNVLLVWPLEAGLRFLANDLHLGGAVAIVLFTIAVRAALFPLSVRQARAQRQTASLREELEALKRRHSKDAAGLRDATEALYRERGISPAGGMLPLLVQMPVLFALYAALRDLGAHEASFQAPWLWLSGLDRPDTLVLAGHALPGPLPVLAAGTQWAQQWLMTRPAAGAGAQEGPAQKGPPDAQGQPAWSAAVGPAVGPVMMLWFGLSASAGLALYWVTQNVVGLAQRRLVEARIRDAREAPIQPSSGATAPSPHKTREQKSRRRAARAR